MNCHDFEMTALSLAREQLLDAATLQQSLAHADVCVPCANRLAEERALMRGVRAVIAEVANERAPASVEAALLKALRERPVGASPRAVWQRPIKIDSWMNWRFEVAAIILILISVMAFIALRSNLLRNNQVVTVSPASLTKPQATSQASKRDDEIEPRVAVSPSQSERQSRARHRAVRHRARLSEEVTEFFPFFEGEDLSSLEVVQMVRLELPASALKDVGFNVASEMTSSPIKADVLLDHDGLARAIRFVH